MAEEVGSLTGTSGFLGMNFLGFSPIHSQVSIPIPEEFIHHPPEEHIVPYNSEDIVRHRSGFGVIHLDCDFDRHIIAVFIRVFLS
jgi:hypothetical protein